MPNLGWLQSGRRASGEWRERTRKLQAQGETPTANPCLVLSGKVEVSSDDELGDEDLEVVQARLPTRPQREVELLTVLLGQRQGGPNEALAGREVAP